MASENNTGRMDQPTQLQTHNNAMPVCEQGGLELLPSNAVDHEVSSPLEFNDLHDFEFNSLYFPYEQPGLGNPELNTIDLELPNLDSLFEGLDLAMEEFWVENNRSLSLLSLYVNNMGQPTKPLEAKKPVLKLSKMRCAGKECSICFSGIKKNSRVPVLKCKHRFHKKCLTQWVDHKSNCPLCRHPIE